MFILTTESKGGFYIFFLKYTSSNDILDSFVFFYENVCSLKNSIILILWI